MVTPSVIMSKNDLRMLKLVGKRILRSTLYSLEVPLRIFLYVFKSETLIFFLFHCLKTLEKIQQKTYTKVLIMGHPGSSVG